ncbi:hypothetical protein [Patulibacter sp.]|uniref:hypothetical protein n=1 Tax=Patulibacter sp. TaxID=1912859 RepID=UPI00271A2446|nr:hypothetical protein [Patulibacter sp.]MDO9407510.1 hypothetical protein [Patulibacter sp.]
MQRSSRRAVPALAATLALVLAGCGGAGYGEPIAATDGGATVALAPAPVTTPAEAPGTTTPRGTTTTGTTSAGGTAPSAAEQDADGAGGGTTSTSEGGGSDGAGGGSGATDTLAAYAVDANRFCTGFKGATRALTTDIGAAGTNTRAVGQAIIRYGSAITSAATGLRAAPVPSSASSYHRRTLAWVSGVTSAISASRSGLASGSQSAGATVVRKVQGLGAPPLGSAVPSALRDRATACAS